jgi:type I restriction enzyme S subunit
MVKGPGVVTGRYGTLGQVFLIRKDFWPLNTTLYVRDFKGNDPHFISYFLRTLDFFAYSDKAAVPGLNRNHLHQAKVICPPVRVQRRIAEILGSLDDKIELNRSMNETLVAMARALFRSWFVDFDPVRAKAEGRKPHGLDAETAKLFPDKFEDSRPGAIPKGWRTGTLGSTCEMLVGFAFPSSGFSKSPPGVRLIRGDNVKEGVIEWGDKTRYWHSITPDLIRYELTPGDVLIGMDGSKVGRNWSRLGANDLPALLVQRVARLRASPPVGPGFIACHVGGQAFKDYIDGVKTGTSIPHVSGRQIAGYPVVLPPTSDSAIVQLFEKTVAPMLSKIDQLRSESSTLASMRDTLLPKLLSGEVQVAADERLEIAS